MSQIGSAFSLLALPLLIYEATGSAAQMGLLTAVAGVASVSAGVFAGLVADRVDRRRLMMVCDLGRVGLFGLIIVMWAVSPAIWALYVIMAMVTALSTTFDIAYVAAVPSMVGKSQVMAANSRLQSTGALSYAIGPTLAGLVIGAFGYSAALAVDAATFALSAAGLALIKIPRQTTEASPARWYDIREGFLTGLGFIWRTPLMRALMILLSVVVFLSLGLPDLIIFRLRHDLGAAEPVVGLVLAVSGTGVIAGALAAGALRRALGFGAAWLGSCALCGVSVALVGLTPNAAATAVLGFACMFGMAVAGICSMSLRQEITPEQLLGRVTSAYWASHDALAPIGAALFTVLADRRGAPVALLSAGLGFLAVAVAGLFTPVRRGQAAAERPAEGE